MAVSNDVLKEFRKIGSALFTTGLNNSHSGNISMRVGNRMFIKRRGAMLGYLEPDDIVEVELYRMDGNLAIASTESRVHASIYINTEALAVVHAHSLATTALSLVRDEIIPIDVEGGYFIKKVPVLDFEYASGSKEMEDILPKYLENYKVAVVRGHGIFSCAATLEEALFYIHSVESSAQMIIYLSSLGVDSKMLEKGSYENW
jgi:L-fuculose-phosphate aldolase